MFFFAPIVCKKEGRWCWGVSSMIPTMSPGCNCPRESQNAAIPSALSKVLQKKSLFFTIFLVIPYK